MQLSTPYLERSKCRDGCSSEHGSVLVEYCAAMTLLLVMALVMIDFGRWLDLHVRASRLVYEAARYASSVPGLEEGTEGPVHDRIQQRISQLLVNYGLNNENVSLSTDYEASATSVTAARTVSVKVDVRFVSLAGGLTAALPSLVRATADTPYLFGS
jgi:Flp pilus assembly protein TadG